MQPSTPEQDARVIIQVQRNPTTSRFDVVLRVPGMSDLALQREFSTQEKAEAWANEARGRLATFARQQTETTKQVVRETLTPFVGRAGSFDQAFAIELQSAVDAIDR